MMRSILKTLPALLLLAATPAPVEAPTGFDNLTNGLTDDQTHANDKDLFNEVEEITPNGLGPVYNAQSCRECHQNPVSGAASQVSELRVGSVHNGRFVNPTVFINNGKDTITGRTLINDRAICSEAQERVPVGNPIRTFRLSLNLLGDGFVEAIPDQVLIDLAKKNGGVAIRVPVLEAPGTGAIGKFGWKDQQASLLSFSADAYLNEMGITNRLLPTEVTTVCNPTSGITEPNSQEDANGVADIDSFARFIRATKAPPRDAILAATPLAQRGSVLFDQIGCSECHVRTFTTAPAGTSINGGTVVVSDAIGGKTFHPFSDFLLHDVGTGDGIAIAVQEHFGGQAGYMSRMDVDVTANRMRTPPLWGMRMRPRLMHDGAQTTPADAINRHRGEAAAAARAFRRLPLREQDALTAFLESL
jgi:CxxC motif-containing protein (DUF1111 family)